MLYLAKPVEAGLTQLNERWIEVSDGVQIQQVRPWHHELIDFMLAQPRASGKETADFLGVTQSWISTVKNTDAFREEWDRRRNEHSHQVSVTLVQRVEALAEITVETMTRKLEKEGDSMGMSTLREVSETALKSLGFGHRGDPRTTPGQNSNMTFNGNVVMMDRQVLADARAARAAIQQNQQARITADFKDHDSAPEPTNGTGVLLPPPGSGAEAIHTDIPITYTKTGEEVAYDSVPPRKREADQTRELVDAFLSKNYQLEAGDEEIEE